MACIMIHKESEKEGQEKEVEEMPMMWTMWVKEEM